MIVIIESFLGGLRELEKLWKSREALKPEERIFASHLATTLVRIFLCGYGKYPRPSLIREGVVKEARDFADTYGHEVIRKLLHIALVIDPNNPYGYIYLIKVMRDWPWLWKEEFQRWQKNLLPMVERWASLETDARGLDGANFAIWSMAKKNKRYRFQEVSYSKREAEELYRNWSGMPIWGKGEKLPVSLPDIPLEEVLKIKEREGE